MPANAEIEPQFSAAWEQAVAALDLSPTSPFVVEGANVRVDIASADHEAATLYLWMSAEACATAVWAHQPDHGAQLFTVPEVLDSGELWCVVQRLEGIQLSELLTNGISERKLLMVIQDVGRTLRKLHSTNEAEAFGGVTETEGRRNRWLTFNGYVAAQLEEMAEDVRSLGLSESGIVSVHESIGGLRQELASFHPRSPASLVHGRPRAENIWVDVESLEVTAISGFGHSRLLPPEYDLAWLLWIDGWGKDENKARELYRGYGAARTMDVQRRERFYRRFVALQALHGAFGDVGMSTSELIDLCTA